jgi:hypothetical protein
MDGPSVRSLDVCFVLPRPSHKYPQGIQAPVEVSDHAVELEHQDLTDSQGREVIVNLPEPVDRGLRAP